MAGVMGGPMGGPTAPGALLLLMADGRFPGGGHAHSGGLEAAVADGSVHDEGSLRSFLLGRLMTSGPSEAWFAAEAVRRCRRDPVLVRQVAPGATERTRTAEGAASLAALAARYEARTSSAAQRGAARTLGRGLRRVAQGVWPDSAPIGVEPYPIVLGIVAHTAGLTETDAARIAVHSLLSGPATAAPKLFAIDMVEAMRAAASLASAADLAVAAATRVLAPPPLSAPLTELRAEAHAAWDVRLFAS